MVLPFLSSSLYTTTAGADLSTPESLKTDGQYTSTEHNVKQEIVENSCKAKN